MDDQLEDDLGLALVKSVLLCCAEHDLRQLVLIEFPDVLVIRVPLCGHLRRIVKKSRQKSLFEIAIFGWSVLNANINNSLNNIVVIKAALIFWKRNSLGIDEHHLNGNARLHWSHVRLVLALGVELLDNLHVNLSSVCSHVFPEHGCWVDLRLEDTGRQALRLLPEFSDERGNKTDGHVFEQFHKVCWIQPPSLLNLDESLLGLLLHINLVSQCHERNELVDVENTVPVHVDLRHEEGQLVFRNIRSHALDGIVKLTYIQESRLVNIKLPEHLHQILFAVFLGKEFVDEDGLHHFCELTFVYVVHFTTIMLFDHVLALFLTFVNIK